MRVNLASRLPYAADKRLVVQPFEASKFRRRSGDTGLSAAGEGWKKEKVLRRSGATLNAALGFEVCSGLVRARGNPAGESYGGRSYSRAGRAPRFSALGTEGGECLRPPA